MTNAPYSNPAPAYSCVICGTRNTVAMDRFSKTYTPRWVWFTVFLGLLPAAIIAIVTRTKHTFVAPFCSRCSKRKKLAGLVSSLSMIGALLCILMALVGFVNGSWVPVILGLVAAVGIAVLAGRYDKSASPRFVVFNAKNVVLDDPVYGAVVLVAPPIPQHQHYASGRRE